VTLIPGPQERSLREASKALRGRALNWMADRRLAVSRFVADSVVAADRVPPARVEVVENGVDITRFTGEGGAAIRSELALGKAPLIACVARFSNEKGVETAIRSVPLLSRHAQLALVGEGEEEARFRALAAELGVASRVRFLGLRHDVERILAAARAVVVPSHWDEAFGLSVIEGMASSRPVIVSRSGAMPDILGDAGLVVPKKDPAALAAAVDRVLKDQRLAAALGRAGRRRAEDRYSMEHYVDRMVAAYESICPGITAPAKAVA
jgi:glycosyltransferase involved in cell wall biosynthesis